MSRTLGYLLGVVFIVGFVLAVLYHISDRPDSNPVPVIIGGMISLAFLGSEYFSKRRPY